VVVHEMRFMELRAIAIAVFIALACFVAGAQSRATSWEIGSVLGVRVGVIDTGGVCIYVANNGVGASTSVSALSKVQLPFGTGCQ
jgi:hypothetical protein